MIKHHPSQTDFRPVSPYDALGAPAQKFVWELAIELGTSHQIIACMLLAMFAAAQVGVLCVVSANFIVGLSTYIACGAPPSTGKSPAVKRMFSALNSLISKYILISEEEAEKRIALICGFEKKIKKLVERISKSVDSDMQNRYAEEVASLKIKIKDLSIPVTPMMGNMSIQSFAKELSLRNGRGIQIDSEGGILALLKTVAASLLDPILQAWSNDQVSDVTKKEKIYIEFPSFVFLILWQCGPLYDIIRDKTYHENGFNARFLIYSEPDLKPKSGVDNVSDESNEWYFKTLEFAFLRVWKKIPNDVEKFEYRLSDSAKKIRKNFKEYIISGLNNNVFPSSYEYIYGKIDVHAIHLAMIIHPMECNSADNCEISGELMYKACCLALYFADHQIEILKGASHHEMLKLSKPLIEEFARMQAVNNLYEWVYDDELKLSIGFSSNKFDRVMIWFEKNGWIMRGIKHRNRIQCGDVDKVKWKFMVDFNILL